VAAKKPDWQRRFDEPIELPDGRELVTLREAIAHLAKTVPKAERNMPEVLTAAEMLTYAAERGWPTMFARIGVMRALNRHHVREFNPDRKDPHWGKRKLKRDQ
jgi:chemotaxis regulatin CheY-phosphate phosphatase CheZ